MTMMVQFIKSRLCITQSGVKSVLQVMRNFRKHAKGMKLDGQFNKCCCDKYNLPKGKCGHICCTEREIGVEYKDLRDVMCVNSKTVVHCDEEMANKKIEE